METENKHKFIIFTQGWDGISLSTHLLNAGYEVMVGQIQDKKELHNDDQPEKADEKKLRLAQYDGMVKKYPAEKLVNALKKVKNKDDYFIFFDQNNLWFYSEQLLKAGFTKGLFPTKEDYEFEKDREKAMEFVKTNYPDVQIIPFEEFKTIDEAVSYIEENEGVYVIQSKGDFVSTYVPQTDDPDVAREQTLGQLEKHRKDYEKGGIIVKTKLINPIEFTPEMVFWNGEVVYTNVDIETKNIGDGVNNGPQVGCGTNLVVKTELEDKVNQIAFPEAVYEMAKGRKGLFFWDISLYMTPEGLFFGEFCPNRPGYDAIMTEIDMAGGVEEYFESIMEGEDPIENKFGVALRLFNLEKKVDHNIAIADADKTWLYEAHLKDGELMSLGNVWDLGVITNSGDDLKQTIDELYEIKDKFSFKEVYTKNKDDFLADYPTSIMCRFKAINGLYFQAPNLQEEMHLSEDGKKIKDLQMQVKDGLESVEKLHLSMKEIGEMKKSLASKIKDKIYGR